MWFIRELLASNGDACKPFDVDFIQVVMAFKDSIIQVSTQEIVQICDELLGAGCDYTEPLIDFALYICQSLDKLCTLFGMKANISLFILVCVLALIKTKLSINGYHYKCGPFDLDDVLEVVIEYLTYLLATIILGSSFWMTIHIIYGLFFQKYLILGVALIICYVSKVKIVKEANLFRRILMSFGFVEEINPYMELFQVC